MRIKTNRQVGGLLFVDQIKQSIRKPKLCIGIPPLRGNSRIPDQGIVSPVDQSKRIQQKEFFCHGTKVNK